MHCPNCGQLQVDEKTRFCSRCGFLLIAVAEVLANNGNFPQYLPTSSANKISPRKRGLRQGVLLLFCGIIIVPLIAIISIAINIDPSLTAIVAIITFVGSILRMIYALLFEESYSQPINQANSGILPNTSTITNVAPHTFNSPQNSSVLPPPQTDFSANSAVYAPPLNKSWRETKELVTPPSVTENTTKFLETPNE